MCVMGSDFSSNKFPIELLREPVVPAFWRTRVETGYLTRSKISCPLFGYLHGVFTSISSVPRIGVIDQTGKFRPMVWNQLASPQTSFGVRSSRIHFSVGEKWMRDERTPKDVCGEAGNRAVFQLLCTFICERFLSICNINNPQWPS